MAAMASAATAPAPPPPGGVLWSVVGDVRELLMLPAALALQVAHPSVAAGVDEYSVFRTDPWGRGERSLRSLQLWVYGGEDAALEGRRVRDLHRDVRGTDAHGRPYHALSPDCYAWVHATGFPVFQHALRYLARPLTEAQERQLYSEWLQVGRLLGVHDRDMPPTIEEFRPYFRRMLAHEVEETALLRELIALDAPVPAPDRGPLPVRALLGVFWPALLPSFVRLRRFLAIGLMPPEARQAIGLDWTEAQERALIRFGRGVRAVVPLLPGRLRWFPLAREARRAAGLSGPTARRVRRRPRTIGHCP